MKSLDHTKLFDFMKILFERPELYKKLKKHDKSRHFFMCQRFMSINAPVQANYLQHIKINPSEVIDYWQSMMTKLYSKVPSWMYIKTAKKKDSVNKKTNLKESTINEFAKKFGYEIRDVKQAITFFGDDMIKEIKQFERVYDIK